MKHIYCSLEYNKGYPYIKIMNTYLNRKADIIIKVNESIKNQITLEPNSVINTIIPSFEGIQQVEVDSEFSQILYKITYYLYASLGKNTTVIVDNSSEFGNVYIFSGLSDITLKFADGTTDNIDKKCVSNGKIILLSGTEKSIAGFNSNIYFKDEYSKCYKTTYEYFYVTFSKNGTDSNGNIIYDMKLIPKKIVRLTRVDSCPNCSSNNPNPPSPPSSCDYFDHIKVDGSCTKLDSQDTVRITVYTLCNNNYYKSNVKINVYDSTGNKLATGNSDSNGSATFEFTTSEKNIQTLKIVASDGSKTVTENINLYCNSIKPKLVV